jgi:hypothetical protein
MPRNSLLEGPRAQRLCEGLEIGAVAARQDGESAHAPSLRPALSGKG